MRTQLKKSGAGLKRLQQLAQRLSQRPHVKAGVLGDDSRGPGQEIGVVELAAIHEFGAPSARPPVAKRSFLRATADAKRNEWAKFAERLLRLLVAGKMPIEQALGLLGERARADIQRFITSRQVRPPNSPLTISLKRSSTPLIDTGRLLQSIAYQVMNNAIMRAKTVGLRSAPRQLAARSKRSK